MSHRHTRTDIILIGAGIMSATLGILLKELVPDWSITVFEKLSNAGEESSNEWNNAGTGHAALCELNYTVEKPDGSVDISKAIKINEQFQVSMQFWSYLVNNKMIRNPQDFILPFPHMSLVQGEQNVTFLKKRFEALSNNPNVVAQHHAKVYGKAKVGAPPMSVPHLDTRFINNKKSLLFGPFAGFSPKFLKTGSMFDLVMSPDNVVSFAGAANRDMLPVILG